jgi:hypothetical protein
MNYELFSCLGYLWRILFWQAKRHNCTQVVFSIDYITNFPLKLQRALYQHNNSYSVLYTHQPFTEHGKYTRNNHEMREAESTASRNLCTSQLTDRFKQCANILHVLRASASHLNQSRILFLSGGYRHQNYIVIRSKEPIPLHQSQWERPYGWTVFNTSQCRFFWALFPYSAV